MGGSSVDDDWVIASQSSGPPRTLVLVGCTGNGKSATCNSILQRKVFFSKAKSSGVTQTCQMHTTVLKDGQTLNVIDTPGLFDCSVKTEFTGKEIAKCIKMAKDGIHAVLVVLSVKTRFSEGEEAVINSLMTLFGKKMTDYLIIVFTGGDDLENDENTLEDYLGEECPKPLQELLQQCENRRVLFDNRTCDQRKKDEQVQELLSLVNLVVAKNDGKPYADELFVEQKIEEVTKEDEEQQITRLAEMVEQKFKESTRRLEQQLAEERSRLEQQLAEERSRFEKLLVEEKAARLSVEKMMKIAEEKSRNKLRKIKENLERTDQKLREQAGKINCVIQ